MSNEDWRRTRGSSPQSAPLVQSKFSVMLYPGLPDKLTGHGPEHPRLIGGALGYIASEGEKTPIPLQP